MREQSHKEVAVEFLRLVASGNVQEAYRKHLSPAFRHHNPFFAGDGSITHGRNERERRQ